MPQEFPHLFAPLDLHHKTLKHRLNFGAHTTNMAEDGPPVERHFGYYTERARGGGAMIVVEPVPTHRTAGLTRGIFRHEDDSIVPHFRKITEACYEHGAVMIRQLYHVGQHGDQDNSFEPNWSPSGLPSFHDCDGSHAMTEAEIEESIEAFAQAALSMESLQEIVVWHDTRELIDTVTCGTGRLLRPSRPDLHLPPPRQAGPALRRGGQTRPGSDREPHPHTGERGLRDRLGPGRHGQHLARPDRRPAPGQQGAPRPTQRHPARRNPAVHFLQSVVLGPAAASRSIT